MKKTITIISLAISAIACQKRDPKIAEKKTWVRGNCEMCKDRIESNVKALNGVKSADWSVETKDLTVSFDTTMTNLDAIESICANVGHATKNKASDAAIIDTLPPCCKPGKNHPK